MISNPFSSEINFKQAFVQGIVRLLAEQEPAAGSFILALANSLQHCDLFGANGELINKHFQFLQQQYLQYDRADQPFTDAPDDVAVMRQLFDIGLDQLQPVTQKSLSDNSIQWLLDYNQLRSLRPARLSKHSGGIYRDFNKDGFHFDKPFLQKEIFIEEEIDGHQLTFFYNKFPFCDFHGLLVPDRHKHNNQFLRDNYFKFACLFYTQLQTIIPGIVLAYNSLGAGASVNHLHFQSAIVDRNFAVESKTWLHHAGELQYPVLCEAYSVNDQAQLCWQRIEQRQEQNKPFNLVFKNNYIYLFFRTAGTVPSIPVNLAWYEVCGQLSLSDKNLFNSLTADQIVTLLKEA